MAWDFETEPEFQENLDWMDEFVREEVEPLDLLFRGKSDAVFDTKNELVAQVLAPLKEEVKKKGLWACHLTPELGGGGYGQVRLALMNEILGRSMFASRVFGCQAPDTGNAELIAHFGNDEQKKKYLKPLLEGEIVSCFSMTEPSGGSDPQTFTCKAWREGDEYVIEGEKWFASNAKYAEFLLVVVVTDPDVPIYKGASILLVPRDTPGLEFVRNVGLGGERIGHGSHAYLRFNKARVPVENCIGGEGQGFVAAQTRLGGGRIHHAMRTVATLKKAFDMMCERALSRFTQGSMLSEKQLVQQMIGDSYTEILQFRLHVMYAAWLIDKHQKYNREVRKEIAATKVATARVMKSVIYRALHIHGSLGVSNELPLAGMWSQVGIMATVDGPSEVHSVSVAKQVLRDYEPAPGLFPTSHLIPKIEAAREKYADLLTEENMHWIANS
ncbi:acyl-CoA dehydrogenase family protein [Myxococcota bacterium]|nr:acyl-CoA dehydrogenase family protein [Myxococcota bacterium]